MRELKNEINGILKRKTERVCSMFKRLSTYICRKKYMKCNIWRVAVRPSYIQDAWFLKVNLFFRKPCRLLDNVENYCRARKTTDANILPSMHFAGWIPKAINTHTDCVIFIACPLQQWLHERASMEFIRSLPVLCQ